MTPSPELQNIIAFLGAQHPWSLLDAPTLAHTAAQLEIAYHPRNRRIFAAGADNSYLYVVRTGAVDIADDNGNLAERCGEGDFFGFPSVLGDFPTRFNATTLEDTLLYMLHTDAFHRLRRDHPAFDQHFVMVHSQRVIAARTPANDDPVPLTMQLKHLLRRRPVTVAPGATIQQAAQQMRAEQISSLLVVAGGRLVGILTDRDLRNRVVAAGLDPASPVSAVMTPDPITIPAHHQTLQAQVVMSQHNIHHLPVVEGDDLVGLVTTTDLMRLQTSSPVYLIGEIAKGADAGALAGVVARLPRLVVGLVDAGATAYDLSLVITQITDAVTRRLLALAEAQLGPPPVPYTWLAFGSQGRREQTARTDQDNGLLLAEPADEAGRAYFAALAAFVCDGLNACGYAYCPGGVMATHWCLSLDGWRERFAGWVHQPEPEALLNATIFFDMRPVYGAAALAEQLQADVLALAQGNARFLGSLAKNALAHQPPLGFFRRFVLERGGEHHHTLDLKRRGVVPVIDLVRVYALAYGVGPANTTDRIAALVPTLALAPRDGDDLRDALAFIAGVRLRHQAAAIAAGNPPDNYVDPNALSSFERQHLQTAFHIVRNMQNTLASRYLTALMS